MLQSDNSTLNFLYAIGAHSDYSECAPLFINMRSSVIGIPANMIQIQSLINISSMIEMESPSEEQLAKDRITDNVQIENKQFVKILPFFMTLIFFIC